MKKIKHLILIILLGCFMYGCATTSKVPFDYTTTKTYPPIDAKIKITTNIDYNHLKTIWSAITYSKPQTDINNLIITDLRRSIFPIIVENNSDINININIMLKFKDPLAWSFCFPIPVFGSVLGIPTNVLKGKIEIDLQIFSKEGKLIGSYFSKKEIKKNLNFYYYSSIIFETCLATTTTQIMDDIISQIDKDRYKIEEAIKQSKSIVSDNANIETEVGKISDKSTITKPKFYSDVDINIPITTSKNTYRFALIIGNEDYTSKQTGLKTEENVDFAIRDAEIFKEYANKTLGIPEENIICLNNATSIEMNRAVAKLNLIIKSLEGKAEIIFYYAGHGYPDPITKEPYLIPVDVTSTDLTYAIKLKDVYAKLTEYPAKKVTVFLDACFSGGGRNQGLLAARGVKIVPKENLLRGNLVVFSSSTGEQSSLPYDEKQHGIFTYYLLKALQEHKGSITYKELSDYLKEKVSIQSAIVNTKEQTPVTNVSIDI